MYIAFLGLVVLISISEVTCTPKKYQAEEGGFNPSLRYYESDLPYEKPYKNKTTYVPQNPIAAPKKDSDYKESRFGAISYGTSGGGYGGTGVSYGATKLDLGGIALGALIGLGIILVIPKIANVFSMAHGGYGRSLEDEMSSVTSILSRLDNSLAANNIDSATCSQRIICTFVNDAFRNQKAGEANGVDEFVLSFTKHPLFSTLIDGTAIKEAVETGRTEDSEKCMSTYSKCPLTRENVLKVITTFLPTN